MLKAPLLLAGVTLTLSSIVNASELTVSFSGTFASSDVATSYVKPGEAFSLSFDIASSPTPLSGTVTSLGFDVPVVGFSYSVNGVPVSPVGVSEITFSTLSNGGLFDVMIGTGLAATEFDFEGNQIFTGTTSTPAVATGSYALTNWTVSDPSNYDSQSPATASVSVVNTPEPSAFALIALSGLTLLGAFRQKLFNVVR